MGEEKKYNFKIADLDKMDPELATRILILYANDEIRGEDEFDPLTLDIFNIPTPQFYLISTIFDSHLLYGGLQTRIGVKSYDGGKDTLIRIGIHPIIKNTNSEFSYSVRYNISLNGIDNNTISGIVQEFPRNCWGSFKVNTNADGHIMLSERYRSIPGETKRVYTDFLQTLFVTEFSHYKKETLLSNKPLGDKLKFDVKECKRLMYNFEELLNKK